MNENTSRFIGIRHRVKKTAEGESRPTQLAIREGEKETVLDLPTETDELDFLLGRLPTQWRKVQGDEDLTAFASHHVQARKFKKGEKPEDFPENLIVGSGKNRELATKVPEAYDGLKGGDTVAMLLGGSGDNLAFALSRRGEEIGARVLRIPPFRFKDHRGTDDGKAKEDDARLLASLAQVAPGAFYDTDPRDRDLILVREHQRSLVEAMKARIACEQRLHQRVIGSVFCEADGRYPEGAVEKLFDDAKANDKVFQALASEERERERRLAAALERYDVYRELFAPIEGCGVRISARLLSAIIDVRRFWVEADQEKIGALRSQSEKLEAQANFEADLDKVAGHLGEGTIQTKYRKVQLVRSWKRANGKEAEAALLDQALALYLKRRDLRLAARKDNGPAKLKAFCGVHVLPDGRFPRRRSGAVANWNPEARQALYLIGDQFNRRPKSPWGQKLLGNKAKLRKAHPEPVEVDGKKRYTDGHIHKMAIWRTLSQFVEWLFHEWTKLERQHRAKVKRLPEPPTPIAPTTDQAANKPGGKAELEAA